MDQRVQRVEIISVLGFVFVHIESNDQVGRLGLRDETADDSRRDGDISHYLGMLQTGQANCQSIHHHEKIDERRHVALCDENDPPSEHNIHFDPVTR
jgi:hypothetical protein